MNSASLVSFFSRLNTGDVLRAYTELLRGFERARDPAEVDRLAQDISELLWALKTGGVIQGEQAQLMDADLSDARDAARQRLEVTP